MPCERGASAWAACSVNRVTIVELLKQHGIIG